MVWTQKYPLENNNDFWWEYNAQKNCIFNWLDNNSACHKILRYKCNPKITNIEEMGRNLIKHREGSCANNSNINIERTIDKNMHVLY